jgi:hypothetical protein
MAMLFRQSWPLVLFFLLVPSEALASARKFDWVPWLIGITVTSSVLAWVWAKRTKMLDNIHLRIVGFSVYFWILAFAQMGVLMVLYALTK